MQETILTKMAYHVRQNAFQMESTRAPEGDRRLRHGAVMPSQSDDIAPVPDFRHAFHAKRKKGSLELSR
jgi:hypothetical protein